MTHPMTPEQIAALVDAASFMDFAAGEGLGMPAERKGGYLWADDIVSRLATAFGVEWRDDFGDAVHKILEARQ